MKTTRCESKGNGWVHTPCLSSSSLDTATNRHLLAVDLANLKMALVQRSSLLLLKSLTGYTRVWVGRNIGSAKEPQLFP